MFAMPATAADLLDPTPVAHQEEEVQEFNATMPAVDGVNFKFDLAGGAYQRNVLGTASNAMFVGSISTPIPYMESFGAQLDLGIGSYDGGFTSATAGLHLFWRDPNVGLAGIYGDWAYVNPEHGGRLAFEGAWYNGRYTVDVLLGIQFGQHYYTEFIDEVDLSYYFTDNFRGSVGHRLMSRGHVANIGFEYLMDSSVTGMDGISVFGEVEGGDDNYIGGWGGVRYSFGSGNWTTLIERDRRADPPLRGYRALSGVTQCGNRITPLPSTFWRDVMTNTCADQAEINRVSATGITKQ